jgi:hypothetical protein
MDEPEGLGPSILLDWLLEGMRFNPALLFKLGYGLQLVGFCAAILRTSSSKARRRPDEMAVTKQNAGSHLLQSLSVADSRSQTRGADR